MSHLAKLISSELFKCQLTTLSKFSKCFCMKSDKTGPSNINVTEKQIVVQGSENVEKMRVRRAKAADMPRVLKFVHQHASSSWPGVPPPTQSVSHVILCDYVSRALAQGHSMLSEHLETSKGWSRIRGVALAGAVCPWDASLLERWSKCVGCSRSKKLMQFTAYCLKAPGLHDKYHVRNLLQVTLIVPPDNPKCAEIVNSLLKASIKRAQETGFPLIRFDVTNATSAQALEDLKLKKEWEMTFDSLTLGKQRFTKLDSESKKNNFIAVYSVQTHKLK